MKTYHHILVGVDFSPASRAALRTAIRIAAFNSTPVTLFHSIEPELASAIKEAHHLSDEDVFKHVNDRVLAFLQESETGAHLVNIRIEVGQAFSSLSNTRDKNEADLVVLGTRGTEHGPNHIGSVAAKAARKIPADVLLVREEVTGPFRHVTACVDFSETSAEAVRAAQYFAEHDQAALDAVFIHQSALTMSLDYGGFLPPLAEVETVPLDSMQEQLNEFVSPLVRRGNTPFRSLVLDRINVREGLLEHIRESETDLVVLGTRGKTDLRTLFIGTTAEKIVNNVSCSVLAVKPEAVIREELEVEDESAPLAPLIPVA